MTGVAGLWTQQNCPTPAKSGDTKLDRGLRKLSGPRINLASALCNLAAGRKNRAKAPRKLPGNRINRATAHRKLPQCRFNLATGLCKSADPVEPGFRLSGTSGPGLHPERQVLAAHEREGRLALLSSSGTCSNGPFVLFRAPPVVSGIRVSSRLARIEPRVVAGGHYFSRTTESGHHFSPAHCAAHSTPERRATP